MAANVTMYVDEGIVVDRKVGAPPVDQSAEVAQLTADLSTANTNLTNMTAARDALQGKLDAIKTARTAEEAGEHSADDARAAIDAALA